MTLRVLLVLLVAAAGACAPVRQAPSQPVIAAVAEDGAKRTFGRRQCFSASSVSGYRDGGEEALHLRVGASQIWRLEFAGQCPEAKWSFGAIGLQQRGGGLICDGLDVDVITNDAGFVRRCLVDEVRRLSAAEVLALPDNQRP